MQAMGSCPVLPHVVVVLLMRKKGDMHVVLRKPDACVPLLVWQDDALKM